MGICFSTTKVSGSNSNTPSTTANNHQHHRPGNDCTASKQASTTTTSVASRKQGVSHYKTKEGNRNQQKWNIPHIAKNSSKRPGGIIPCGKRTDFGYDKDFDSRYTIGKLLGHGQFGYTYVAIDKSNGDRVAVKKIEKKKVFFFNHFFIISLSLSLFLIDS